MEQRALGRSGLTVSVIGFGCGAVGGLLVKGSGADQERAVARALATGITYFDTAADYGQGVSETNLGRVLKSLGADPIVGTKVRLLPGERDIAGAIARSFDASLQRMGRERVHLFQLHNPISSSPAPTELSPEMVQNDVLPAFEKLRAAGKTQALGITAIGEPGALETVMGLGAFTTAQLPYNLLNAAPGSDAGRLLDSAAQAGVGVIGIRTFAGGALSGSTARGPLGTPIVTPIGSGADYAADVADANRFRPLIEAGFVNDLIEAALRFAITTKMMGTAMVGLSGMPELDHAIAAAERGPLPAEALAMIGELRTR